MIERDLGRIADSLESIAEVLKLKYFGKTMPVELSVPEKSYDDSDLEDDTDMQVVSEKVADRPLTQEQMDAEVKKAKENIADKKSKGTMNRKEIMEALDERGIKYNKKAGAAVLLKKLENSLEDPSEPETAKEKAIDSDLMASTFDDEELSEELQEAKEKEAETGKVEEEPKQPTLDEVRALLSQFAQDFGPEMTKGILVNDYKVDKLSQLPEDKYLSLIERIGQEIKKQNNLAANEYLD